MRTSTGIGCHRLNLGLDWKSDVIIVCFGRTVPSLMFGLGVKRGCVNVLPLLSMKVLLLFVRMLARELSLCASSKSLLYISGNDLTSQLSERLGQHAV